MAAESKKCFVLMPFTDALKEIYTDVYAPTCARHDLKCWRVDEISGPGSITRDIIEGILDADIIIADLTNQNPNVFYELGIAHATGNKTIMTAQTMAHVPFDIANYRVLVYEHTLKGCKKLESDLDNTIKELLSALDLTNNPFQEVASLRSSMRVKQRVPIAKYVDLSRVSSRILDFMRTKNIRYKEDFTPLLLEEFAAVPGVGRTYLSQLCTILMQNDLFEDVVFLNDFVLKHRLDASGTARYF